MPSPNARTGRGQLSTPRRPSTRPGLLWRLPPCASSLGPKAARPSTPVPIRRNRVRMWRVAPRTLTSKSRDTLHGCLGTSFVSGVAPGRAHYPQDLQASGPLVDQRPDRPCCRPSCRHVVAPLCNLHRVRRRIERLVGRSPVRSRNGCRPSTPVADVAGRPRPHGGPSSVARWRSSAPHAESDCSRRAAPRCVRRAR